MKRKREGEDSTKKPTKKQNPQIPIPSGLIYHQDIITRDEETTLLEQIDNMTWTPTSISRRVQHYGYKYDYQSRKLDESCQVEDIPDFCDVLIDRLIELEMLNERPYQMIINEYTPGQGIAPHVDKVDFFEERIVSVSLGSGCLMEFSLVADKKVKRDVLLERRSAVLLSGDARFTWKHGIAKRKTDMINGRRVQRDRRVSLTFRKVKLSD
eukprot:TRINITY_DN7566_c0_g1_i1.p1 TRINITY_DN7566_c0_g1~~TRINITY_DN7566_c0_g1_i1.p1  ORF type:complete len:211 (+),score=44.50 TRINITY_DN7566_c0_g1_i1:6-638(+)